MNLFRISLDAVSYEPVLPLALTGGRVVMSLLTNRPLYM